MKKIIITETQLNMVINNVINEQNWNEQPSVKTQMMTVKPKGGQYRFSKSSYQQIKNDTDFVLVLVQKADTIDSIVRRLNANSVESVLAINDLLKNDPRNLRPGDVIAVNIAPAM